jgi:quercetin dioxygenase-like cupin family protein
MKINANFSEIASVHTDTQEWIPSPMAGVDRKPLDRVGDEVARATSIVRYAPKSHFSPHVHTGGEEFIVLEGIFQDQHGDYPVGSYVRNPPQSKHQPGSEEGCVIFVKLWQFQPQDRQHVNLIMSKADVSFQDAKTQTIERTLFTDELEQVKYIELQAGCHWDSGANNGNELLVISGSVKYKRTELNKHDWLRLPIGQTLHIEAGNKGAKVWIKTGNLADLEKQINRLTEV